jgi:hypothetical protein
MSCILCGVRPPIKNSHVVPKFVYKRLKAGSPLNQLRHSQNFNMAVQDGWKGEYLCKECDNETVSEWENYFASTIYAPWIEDAAIVCDYDERLSLFLASLHLRNLEHQFRNHPGQATSQAIALTDHLREMCKNADPKHASVRQHLELVKPQCDPGAWPAGVNTYLRETVDMYVDTPPTAGNLAVCRSFVLLPQCVCMTTDFDLRPEIPKPALVDAVEVHAADHLDSGDQSGLLLALNREHVLERAADIQANYARMSAAQKQKIMDKINANPKKQSYRAHETWELDITLLKMQEAS